MEIFRRLLLLFCVIPFFAGCSSTEDLRTVNFGNLSSSPVSGRTWKSYIGMYQGTVHTTARSFGTTAITVTEIQLELSGTPENPLIYLVMDSSCTSAWAMSGSYSETFTNIIQRRYGIPAWVVAESHGPNQLLIKLQTQTFSPYRDASLLLTFRGNGSVGVDFIGRYGRHGSGRLESLPAFNYTR